MWASGVLSGLLDGKQIPRDASMKSLVGTFADLEVKVLSVRSADRRVTFAGKDIEQ